VSETQRDPRRVLTNFVTGEAGIDPHLTQEWLVTNGLGGYASGTVLGPISRRYHGLLIAALPNPLGRFMMLHGLSERFRMAGKGVCFAGPPDIAGTTRTPMMTPVEFRLDCGLPIWVYEIWGSRIEKRIFLPYRHNTVHVEYRHVVGQDVLRLGLRPGLHLRNHDDSVDTVISPEYMFTAKNHRLEISSGAELPILRLASTPKSSFTYDPKSVSVDYLLEKRRGYPSQGSLWSPGYFRTDLEPGGSIVLTASTESWEIVDALPFEEVVSSELFRRRTLIARATPEGGCGILPELVLAADQFPITPVGRAEDAARRRAAGEEPLTVIAGYHWFTDWGRDTMISLEGLALCVGRHQEARWVLHTFADYIHDGLIPNMFPEGEKQGLYHTADATLWYFHALARYLTATNDRETLSMLLPKLRNIADAHIAGTRFGIHVDANDGLLVQGQEGYQLTWMDAKVGDWVVTPRRGKAVEINALWYNALCLLSRWIELEEGAYAAKPYREHSERTRKSFNRRFWNPQTGYLFDVVDGESGGGKPGDDPACRPNQLFAISLDHPILDREHWEAVVDAATKHLWTPVGLRSLAPFEPDYKQRYDGDLRARDAAYHQGSVWGWLIGPYIDSLAKVHPESCTLDLLQGFESHLNQACVGSISEIFDAEDPHTPRGCVAQAWSIAEVLRCYSRLACG
jgi:predicted glycogen debranching enzyme